MEAALSDTTAGAISADYVEWCTDEADEIEINAEPRDRYESGRLYYPVCIGEVLAHRYRIVHKLGFGGFSTVWMAYDMKEGKDVALKILTPGKDGEREYFAQGEIIRLLRDTSNLVTYHATFQLRGRNNDLHRVLVLPLMGPNLETTRLEMPVSTHMPIRMSVARQLLVALKSLHDAEIVHQDLNEGAIMWEMKSLGHGPTRYEYLGRPEKLRLEELWKPGDLVRPITVPQWLLGDRIYLGDFGMAIAAGTSVEFKVQTPAVFCAPERYHNINPSSASDMWSYMCIFATLYLGFRPFSLFWDNNITSAWVDTLGPLPNHWKGHFRYFEDKSNNEWYDQNRKACDHQSLVSKVARRKPAVSPWEQDLVLSVFAKVFCYEPADRITAAGLLEDPQFNTLMEIYNPKVC